jgi:hypothetical protein
MKTQSNMQKVAGRMTNSFVLIVVLAVAVWGAGFGWLIVDTMA